MTVLMQVGRSCGGGGAECKEMATDRPTDCGGKQEGGERRKRAGVS